MGGGGGGAGGGGGSERCRKNRDNQPETPQLSNTLHHVQTRYHNEELEFGNASVC